MKFNNIFSVATCTLLFFATITEANNSYETVPDIISFSPLILLVW